MGRRRGGGRRLGAPSPLGRARLLAHARHEAEEPREPACPAVRRHGAVGWEWPGQLQRLCEQLGPCDQGSQKHERGWGAGADEKPSDPAKNASAASLAVPIDLPLSRVRRRFPAPPVARGWLWFRVKSRALRWGPCFSRQRTCGSSSPPICARYQLLGTRRAWTTFSLTSISIAHDRIHGGGFSL